MTDSQAVLLYAKNDAGHFQLMETSRNSPFRLAGPPDGGARTDFSALRQCRLRLGKASEFAFRSACTPFFYGVSALSGAWVWAAQSRGVRMVMDNFLICSKII